MAKFSFDDADDDPPAAAASGSEKRKREDSGPDEAGGGGGPPKARIFADRGGGPEGGAVVGAERAEGSGRKAVETVVDGEADGISVRIDPDVLDCSICFEPLRPPLYQVVNSPVENRTCCLIFLVNWMG